MTECSDAAHGAIQTHFPGAVPQKTLFKEIEAILAEEGLSKPLFATSCCPDEINRELDLQQPWGLAFTMGGLRFTICR